MFVSNNKYERYLNLLIMHHYLCFADISAKFILLYISFAVNSHKKHSMEVQQVLIVEGGKNQFMRQGINNRKILRLVVNLAFLFIILIVIGVILMQKRYSQDQSMWENHVACLSSSSVRDIQIINYTPSGAVENQIKSNQFDKYIQFILSIDATPIKSKLLSGVSANLTIELENDLEFSAQFMPHYVIIENKYYFEITNYGELAEEYHELLNPSR